MICPTCHQPTKKLYTGYAQRVKIRGKRARVVDRLAIKPRAIRSEKDLLFFEPIPLVIVSMKQ